MKHIIFNIITVLVLLLAVQSCTIDTDSIVSEPSKTKESIALRIALNSMKAYYNTDSVCGDNNDDVFEFGFVYPIELSYNTNTNIEVSNVNGLKSLLNSETSNLYITSIKMPFEVEMDDGAPLTIQDEQGFIFLLDSCESIILPTDDYFTQEECFSFVYPIQLITLNEEVYTINSDDDFNTFVVNHQEDWYFEFVFPFDVVNNEGITVTLANDYEFFNLLSSCFDEGCNCYQNYDPVCVAIDAYTIIEFYNSCEANCYGYTEADFVVCPNMSDCVIENVTIVVGDCNPNNSYEITVDFDYANNIDDYVVFYINGYYTSYFLDELPISLNYPYSGEGTDQLEILMDGGGMCYTQTFWEAPDCGEVQSTFLDAVGSCYNFNFPIEAMVDGTRVTITDNMSLFDYFDNPVHQQSNLIFPLSILELSTDIEYIINSDSELASFIEENCDD